jgi:[acyl-carrier-protein] S-malonyltransferase
LTGYELLRIKMDTFAFLFPGQGSQYVGMGEDLYKCYPVARDIFDQANDLVGFDLARLCFRGPEEDLDLTEKAQPAVFTVSVACLKALNSQLSTLNSQLEVVAGHSLGEYTALVAAGALEFAPALRLIHKRGRFMKEASEENPGGMMAIIGLSREGVEKVCEESPSEGGVQLANLNCPGQVVVSGSREALKRAGEKAKEAGARKVVNLAVSGPFHSSLMISAAEKLAREIETLQIRVPKIPFLANVKGDFLSDPSRIKEALINQVSNPVRWEASMKKMLKKGIKSFLEIGPGKVLTGLLRRIDKTAIIYSVGDKESLRQTVKAMKGYALQQLQSEKCKVKNAK